MKNGKFRRLTLVLLLPLIIAGFLTAKFSLKHSYPSMRCANFSSGYSCESMDYESGRKNFFDSNEVFSGWFVVSFDSLDEKYNYFTTDLKSTPFFLKNVLVEGVNENLFLKQDTPKFLKDVLGEPVMVRLGAYEDDLPSGNYKDGAFLACNRVVLKGDSTKFKASCKIGESAYNINLSPKNESYDDVNKFKGAMIEKMIELNEVRVTNYLVITFSYLALYFLISLIIFIIYKISRYVIHGSKNKVVT